MIANNAKSNSKSAPRTEPTTIPAIAPFESAALFFRSGDTVPGDCEAIGGSKDDDDDEEDEEDDEAEEDDDRDEFVVDERGTVEIVDNENGANEEEIDDCDGRVVVVVGVGEFSYEMTTTTVI